MVMWQDELRRELDEWADAGLTARFWWRDDDAVRDGPQLRRLLSIAQDSGIVVALAVIPAQADPSLAERAMTAPCCIWQHGLNHQDYGSGEFGEGRSLDRLVHDAVSGQRRLDRRFTPSGWQRVFVPPFHALSMPFKMQLADLGYAGLSAGDPLIPAVEGMPEINADIEVVDWANRKFVGAGALATGLVDQLARRREAGAPADAPLGLLTHHLVLDEEAWVALGALFALLVGHPAAELVPADTLFGAAGSASPSRHPRKEDRAAADEVSVVVTSCGRQDLLERTLDSFFHYNTYPIREVIVIEDGDGARNRPLVAKYQDRPIRWLATGTQRGQIAAIDAAYAEVDTEYIFHCEDDWQFIGSGFIEESLAILRSNDEILQVWIRALDDTNGHPVLDYSFTVGDVPYQILQPVGYYWHGFSFNPGLRRRSEYRLIGQYGGVDPEGSKRSLDVESAIGTFYRDRGFVAAILADGAGEGYVRHIGEDRHVPEMSGDGGSGSAVASADPARS